MPGRRIVVCEAMRPGRPTTGVAHPMNFLVLGDGPEELAWARALAEGPEHKLWAAYPGFKAFPGLPGGADLDEALATAGVEAVIVGGGPELRAEGLRRAAAAGLPSVCLHPPGDNADAYYQVALSRQETGAIVVPDLPARLHPSVAALRQAIDSGELGTDRGLRYEMPAGPADGPLLGRLFPRAVDVVRTLVGEIEAVTATGDASESLLVVLRGAGGRRAELRLWAGTPEPARLSLAGERGTLTLEFEPDAAAPSRLVRREGAGAEAVTELESWDPWAALLGAFVQSVRGQEGHPDLLDGTRAMELAEATARSLRRGRTIDLHYEEISEAGTFKALMTSTGCMLLFFALVLLPVSLVGPALGLGWTLYLAYAIPPVLVLFLMLQVLRFATKKAG